VNHAFLLLPLLLTGFGGHSFGATPTVKVAAVHFEPKEGDPPHNIEQLVQLTTEAAQHGAKIVVHTEMATSGYSFFSREQIASVAEPIPGPTTKALGGVAKRFGIYVAVGLPEHETSTNLYFNAVALIGPKGNVIGVYRKRNNLLEAAYNGEVWSPVPTFETPYGRIAVVICADMFYDGFPRLAGLSGVNILLAPANVGITSDFLKVRTWENDFSMVVANRFGSGGKGSKLTYFNQNSFAIPSPFAYDFAGSHTIIVSNRQDVIADVSEARTQIAYGDLPVRAERSLPVIRRPSLYSLLAQDTLESYTFSQFGLPPASDFGVAGVDPGASTDPWKSALAAAQRALDAAKSQGLSLRLIVLPGNFFRNEDVAGMASLKAFTASNRVDIQAGFAGVPPRSILIASNGETYAYSRTHQLKTESIPEEKLGKEYWVVDRDYGRVAMLHDVDLMAPETSMVIEKMGVDIVALNADNDLPVASALWQSRTGSYYNIVMANRRGTEGVYVGGYPPGKQLIEAEGLALMKINTKYVRSKKEPRFLDFEDLLKPCSAHSCR